MENVTRDLEKIKVDNLRGRQEELALLEEKLCNKNVYLNQLKLELREFETGDYKQVLTRLSELEEINREISRVRGLLTDFIYLNTSTKNDWNENAQLPNVENSLNEKSESLSIACKNDTEAELNRKLKSIYRKVAKLIHPDFCLDAEDEQCRKDLMAKVNLAYEAGSTAILLSILCLFQEDNSESEQTESSDGLALVSRQMHKVKIQIAIVNDAIHQLESSEIFEIKSRIELGRGQGRNLIIDMISQLECQIKSAKCELSELEKQLAKQAHIEEV